MCKYIIQNIVETIRHLVPRLHLQRFGRWSLGTNLDSGTSAPVHGVPSRLPSRDCVSRSYHGATQMRASLSRCVIARAVRSPEKGDQSGTLRGPRRLRPATSRYRMRSLPVALSYVARLAEPRPRIRECLTLRVCAVLQSNAISHVA